MAAAHVLEINLNLKDLDHCHQNVKGLRICNSAIFWQYSNLIILIIKSIDWEREMQNCVQKLPWMKYFTQSFYIVILIFSFQLNVLFNFLLNVTASIFRFINRVQTHPNWFSAFF